MQMTVGKSVISEGTLFSVSLQHFIMQIKNLTVALEEQLLLKVAQFLYQGIDEFNEEVIPDNQVQRAHAAASANAKRFYFNTLKLRLDQVKLSVLTMSQRPPELDTVKKKTGWSLMRFEDVAIELGKCKHCIAYGFRQQQCFLI